MTDVGTITSIEPEDGLGWIELESGDKVRFGGTACKGFVPAVGMVVRVLGSRPGYGGTVKATELQRVADAPRAAFAKEAGAEPAAEPRTGLHTIQNAGVPADDLLLKVLAQADVDDALFADLAAASFEVQPGPARELGCPNLFCYAVAQTKDGGGAYCLYPHPMFAEYPAPPWLYWERASGSLRFVAMDTATALQRVLATAAASGVDAQVIERLRRDLSKMGMPEEPGAPVDGGEKVEWLPPDPAELRPLDAYLAETDGGEMERGLLAHASRPDADPRAVEALRSLYGTWGWSTPPWAG